MGLSIVKAEIDRMQGGFGGMSQQEMIEQANRLAEEQMRLIHQAQGVAAASAPSAAGGWFCPECGTRNSGKFCENCGTARP